MKRLCSMLVLLSLALFGCGGGGGTPAPANVAGRWMGTMDHDVSGKLLHFPVALILSQEGAHVTGTMILEYGADGHGGRIDGDMHGNHFTGSRTARHVADIEFDVTGDTLVGTFTFVSVEENLNEHGTFICTREHPPQQTPTNQG